MSHSSVRHQLVTQCHDEPLNEVHEDIKEDAELQPLAPNKPLRSSPVWISCSLLDGRSFKAYAYPSDRPPLTTQAPPTPMSSDGVFANIPAKPSSSRDKVDEDLGEDEWIFMTSEQRRKMPPPKYSRIKRDRAPRYTTEYTPPQLPTGFSPRKRNRELPLDPLVNSLPAGSSSGFVAMAFLCTLLPFLGYFFAYAASMGRWKTHACRLGARTGLGLGLIHVGAMLVYIPASVPSIFSASSIRLIAFVVWTVVVGLPIGWRLSSCATKEFMWAQAHERVLRRDLGLPAASCGTTTGYDEDLEIGRSYIEGTDIRVRDLRKIIARARDARLARYLRAAGF